MPAPKARAIDIFVVAEQFRFASRLAAIAPATDVPLFRLFPAMPTAAMACSAFSLELYFKCLIRIGSKKSLRTHDLARLFSSISRKNQSKIRRLWRENSEQVRSDVEAFFREASLSPPKVDFEYVLSVSREALVKFRYIYDGLSFNEGWLGDSIVEAARAVILAKYPSWENARQAALLPKTSFGPTFQAP